MNREEIVQLINAAALGDETAIERLAGLIERAPAPTVAPPAAEAFEASQEFRRDFRDVVSDGESYQQATKFDSQIAAAHPALDIRTRFNIAGMAARRGSTAMDVAIDADRAAMIEAMKLSRKPSNSRDAVEQVFHEDDDDSTAIVRGRRRFGGMEAS
jgi:hypothetical protein